MAGNLVETLIGAIVLVVAGAFFAFTYSSTDIGPISGYDLVAKFNRVDGLAVGSDVRLAGIKVGTVTSQTLDPKSFRAVVRMTIDKQVHLPDDTAAQIKSEGLLGGNYLSLEPGGSPDYLENGDEITFTQGAVDLMSLISKAIYGSAKGGAKQE